MLWVLLAVFAIALGYWNLIRPFKYWVRKGIKQGNPVPFFGDFWGIFLRLHSFADMVQMLYRRFPNERYSGVYQFFLPTLVIRDPELIKQITVKDFDHFLDHRNFLPEDPLFNKTLIAVTGQKWRKLRATLSPAFTSSKMKFMFSLMTQSGEQFVNYFLQKNEDLFTLEMKDTFSRFTNDVIANTAFGVECDSLRDRNNEFFLMGKEFTNFRSFFKNLKFFSYLMAPTLYKILKIRVFPEKVETFFKRLVKTNIASREKFGIVRPDMIHLLLEARKNGLRHEESQPDQDAGFATAQESEVNKVSGNIKAQLTDDEITSQAFIFFFAGFDGISYLMSFMSYELAINPEIQDRLTREVDETLELCKGRLTYEALLKMKYMDMVLCEILRKWPGALLGDRICTKPYTIEPKNPGEKSVHLDVGDAILLPIFGLHRDPELYPDPERFDPERFSDENKDKIQPYTYMPFGVGPRNCIGSRFAILETKTLFFYILAQFQFVVTERTEIPLKLCKKQFNLTAENGFWLGLKRRVKIEFDSNK